MKVLIVDDEMYMVDYLKRIIDWSGYGFDQVLTAGGGALAWQMIRENRPQLLITDIRMPRVSGLDLVRMIDEEKIDTKVIILSGYSEFEYAKQAVHYGVSEYLVKPVLKEALEEALQNVLHKNFQDTPVVEKDTEGTSGDSQDIIPFIKTYVYENFDKDLSLDHLGQVVHLHPTYLSKVFKDETDMNLSSYITDIRMQKAAELLEQTDLRVYEVMETVGYQKSQYFAKLFKEKFGVTPKEYRKSCMKEYN